jgi:hypothetical protein
LGLHADSGAEPLAEPGVAATGGAATGGAVTGGVAACSDEALEGVTTPAIGDMVCGVPASGVASGVRVSGREDARAGVAVIAAGVTSGVAVPGVASGVAGPLADIASTFGEAGSVATGVAAGSVASGVPVSGSEDPTLACTGAFDGRGGPAMGVAGGLRPAASQNAAADDGRGHVRATAGPFTILSCAYGFRGTGTSRHGRPRHGRPRPVGRGKWGSSGGCCTVQGGGCVIVTSEGLSTS